MANTKQTRKRARQNEKERLHNKHYRTRFRTAVKQVHQAIMSGDQSSARRIFQEAVSVIDRVASKGIIHKNKAARHKKRLSQQINTMAASKKDKESN